HLMNDVTFTDVSTSCFFTCILSDAICFFFNDPATTEIYTLSLTTLFRSQSSAQHDRVGIEHIHQRRDAARKSVVETFHHRARIGDRKSTRLNSSHDQISYAVFCLKKKTNHIVENTRQKSRSCSTTTKVSG